MANDRGASWRAVWEPAEPPEFFVMWTSIACRRGEYQTQTSPRHRILRLRLPTCDCLEFSMSDSFIVKPETRPCPPPQRRKVLVTGAGGSIGSYFAAGAHAKYDLTLLDPSEQALTNVRQYGQAVQMDLSDVDELQDVFDGRDTIVHLAAEASPQTSWKPLLETNICGTHNTFMAAEAAGCRRVVFASSIHAVSGYSVQRQVQADDPVSPGDLYGVTKCFGEAMGRYMATQHDLSVICIRIGGFQPIDRARRRDSLGMMNAFVSRRNLNQLLNRCVDDEQLQFACAPYATLTRGAEEPVGFRPIEHRPRCQIPTVPSAPLGLAAGPRCRYHGGHGTSARGHQIADQDAAWHCHGRYTRRELRLPFDHRGSRRTWPARAGMDRQRRPAKGRKQPHQPRHLEHRGPRGRAAAPSPQRHDRRLHLQGRPATHRGRRHRTPVA
ncbi:MAG: NAD-dependent epimerase/dehydratase family protein [Planctomycetes bacterium]|nr:NAD-dependent epimerase/dehydratase family protein [Planctomycetota bacterium]